MRLPARATAPATVPATLAVTVQPIALAFAETDLLVVRIKTHSI